MMTEFKTTSDLTERDLDGIYLRARIDGHWQNRCLTDLVWEDVEAWLKEKIEVLPESDKVKFLLQAAKHLHGRLRDIGDQLDIMTRPRESE